MNIFRKKTQTLVISERNPEYKVRYLGNVLTAFVKGDGCVDRPTQVLWNNYVTNCASSPTGNAGLDMELTVCGSGLKVVTKEQGLTEYRAHRITYSLCPTQHPRLFVWVYRHDGKKLKQEVRCHAVLCKTDLVARTIAAQLSARRATALDEFRREKKRRQNSRLLTRSNSVPPEATCPGGGAVRTKFLVTGQNFRPSIDRSTSAPKLGMICEGVEEEPGTIDTMSVRRQSLLDMCGRQHGGHGGINGVSDLWLTEEYEGPEEDDDDDPTLVTFSVPSGDRDASKPVRRHSTPNVRPLMNGLRLTDDGGLVVASAGIGDTTTTSEVLDLSVEMIPGVGLNNDSDNDSTESGFSEQDGPALDSR